MIMGYLIPGEQNPTPQSGYMQHLTHTNGSSDLENCNTTIKEGGGDSGPPTYNETRYNWIEVKLPDGKVLKSPQVTYYKTTHGWEKECKYEEVISFDAHASTVKVRTMSNEVIAVLLTAKK